MWTKSFSKVYPNITREAVWNIWQDVNNYTTWHDDLDYCRLEGEFKVGNFFRLKPTGAPEFKVVLTEINKNHSFTDCTKFFGAKMYDTHELEDTADGVRISNTIKVTGPLAFLWTKLVAKNVAASAPKEADAIAKLAEVASA